MAPVSIYPVILSGGTGTRLWPLSRADFPKQFISFFDEQDETLLEATLSRLAPEGPVADPILLANERHGSLIREILARRNIAARPLLLEPVARNTAPSVTTAALYLADRKPGAIMAVMPSDHLIADPARFREQILAAAALAARSRIVLFGVEALCPHPGYGYLCPGAPLSRTRAGTAARRLERFIEKPAQPELSRLIAEGWLWNSGIFVMRAETLLEEMERADPDMVRNCRAALDAARKREGGLCLQRSAYSRCRAISLDHAVMERTRNAVVVPFRAGWKDVGSWPALWEISSQDSQGNAVIGDAILEESRNCLIHSRDALVGALGVEDLVIAATADAILVSRRDQGHRVGELLSRLPRERRGNQPPRVRICRPWGWFETLGLGPGFKVKRLHVKVGGRLSLQRHEHRSEHWVVVSGAARVTRGSHTRKLREKESILIAAGEWHRLENAGSEPLELIEIQTGSYLGEDDIRRRDNLPRGPQAGGVLEPEG